MYICEIVEILMPWVLLQYPVGAGDDGPDGTAAAPAQRKVSKSGNPFLDKENSVVPAHR